MSPSTNFLYPSIHKKMGGGEYPVRQCTTVRVHMHVVYGRWKNIITSSHFFLDSMYCIASMWCQEHSECERVFIFLFFPHHIELRRSEWGKYSLITPLYTHISECEYVWYSMKQSLWRLFFLFQRCFFTSPLGGEQGRAWKTVCN